MMHREVFFVEREETKSDTELYLRTSTTASISPSNPPCSVTLDLSLRWSWSRTHWLWPRGM